jgi:hypothetical protein
MMETDIRGYLVGTETHQIIINRKEKPNSYEVGKAGNRFTIFFDTPEDLKAQLDKLKDLGFLKEDGV